jgi:circadian clock protein KaiC
MRLIDLLKTLQITSVFTSLTSDGIGTSVPDDRQSGISSLMDTWLLLLNVEFNGERNRMLYVLKSRGMAHSNQVREFLLSDAGIDLRDVYLGGGRILTGSARVAQEAQERADAGLRQEDHARRLRQLAAKQKALESQIAALQAEYAAEEAEVTFAIAQETFQTSTTQQDAEAMAALRGGVKRSNSGLKANR